jgi:hypothetical protein
MIAAADDQFWAQADGLPHRHGGTDAQLTGGVRAGRNHSTAFWSATHCERFAAQFRLEVFLYSAVERVQVHVNDRTVIYHFRIAGT